MSALAQLQRAFAAALHEERIDAAAPLVRAAGVSPAARLALYRRNMRAAHHDALAATYPVVRRLVGDAFFHVLALDYVRARPSRSGNLDELGDALASFVAAYPPARELPYLAPVARLEWACHESASAPDALAFDAAALTRVPAQHQGAIRLRLHPSVRLVDERHAVASIWEANQPGRDGTIAGDAAEAECALVWRDGALVRVRRVQSAERAFVGALAEGADLDAAVAAMGEVDAAALSATLERLGASGAIAGFTPGEGAA